ncbi:Nramp family divalent metal transporter [Bythopirellula goksoeyrii]|uniref:Manganese transport protein MntH n=1 Tax=Bythopirellula goksoeyrii TaxID=1400387 RepID=A0A5B9QEV0_9BACT|nr:Nramp family divalent metal transporter [Bythopirellula goksoeyrii]QEG32853.1 manganese transport protein MntH [Bythopirellula goksoeyrii]
MPPRDPYVLDPASIQEPPTRFLDQLKYCGPGFVLSASIVGSGELIATTTLGAKAGFTALWVILVSCLVKVVLQLEFGRHTIHHGETALVAINKLPGWRIGRVHWTIWFWLALLPIKILQVGGIVGGLAILLNLIMPTFSIPAWCAVVAITVAALVFSERYKLIEMMSLSMTCVFTILTLVSVAALQWTDYGLNGNEILDGLRGQVPPGALLFVFAAFGLTGVGGDEIMQYTYWLLEKGYASRVGSYQRGDADWLRRAKGWTRVMVFDALLSMLAYTTVTAAFYILGAAVLHARDEIPAGNEMVATLANMYTESLGPWARDVFLAGAFFVLFSTTFSALAAWTRIYSDTFSQFGWIDFTKQVSRVRTIKILAWVFPTLWTITFLWIEQPVLMVMLGGLATAAILLIVVVAAFDFRYRRSLPELNPGILYDVVFWISTVSIVSLACYGIWTAVASWLAETV